MKDDIHMGCQEMKRLAQDRKHGRNMPFKVCSWAQTHDDDIFSLICWYYFKHKYQFMTVKFENFEQSFAGSHLNPVWSGVSWHGQAK